MSIITGTTIEYETKKHGEITSAYTYNPFFTAWNNYTLDDSSANTLCRWSSPTQTINLQESANTSYVDLVWLYGDAAALDKVISVADDENDTLNVITKLDIQKYKLVIDGFYIVQASDAGVTSNIEYKSAGYELQENEYIRNYITHWENKNDPTERTSLTIPALRYVVNDTTWYFEIPDNFPVQMNNDPRYNKLKSDLQDVVCITGDNVALGRAPMSASGTWTYPSLGKSFIVDKNDDFTFIFSNPSEQRNVVFIALNSIEAMLKSIALLGVYFEYDGTMYLGFMDSTGQTTGEYLTADKWNTSAQYQSENINNYTEHTPPYVPPSPEGDNYANMGIGVGTGVGGYTSFAIMTRNDLLDLLADFNANLETGMSVVNNFICLYKLGPLASYLCSTRVGNIIMSANADDNFVSIRADYNIVTSQKNVITMGSYNVPRMTNTFYDFAPYSTYELFIPCCGWVPLPDTVAGRQITVYMIIDLSSCTCKGVCRIDGTTVAEASGVLGVSVPFFSTDSGLKHAADIMSVTQMISGLAQGAVGAGAGAGALVVSGSANALQGLEQLYINGNTNYTAIKGGNGDITAVGNGEYCTIKITHPKVDEVVNNSRFGHSVGYLCNIVGKIKEFKGLTICANPHVNGIDCTESEKEEIKRLLEEGIIVN